ncbi:MAG: GHKL domain-containing protein [FCB group bacterium]|nr:GHKL domain-containing protein [FCB group bacterium]
MTEKKTGRDENLQELAEIRQEISKLKAENEKLAQQLMHSSRLASLGEMSAGIAHEINQPLAIIRARTELLRMRSREEGISAEELTEELSEILLKVDKAVLLIEQMRGFSRKDSGFVEHIDITEPVDRALIYFREQFRMHKIKLTVSIEENLPKVRANSQNVEQMVINFISNARHAVEKKIPEGKSGEKKVFLKVQLDKKRKSVVIEVTDNGVGMTPEEKKRCLDPFYTTKAKGEGTGLGLSIVHNIIKEMNGKLEITSSVKAGTTMRVLIPVE